MNHAVASYDVEIEDLARIFAARRAAGRRSLHAEEVRQRVVALCQAGISKPVLAKKFGIATTLIWKWEQRKADKPSAAKVVLIKPPQPAEPRQTATPCEPLRLQFGAFRITIEAVAGA